MTEEEKPTAVYVGEEEIKWNYPSMESLLSQAATDFYHDNLKAIKCLISKMAEVQSAVITLDLQRGIIVAANTTTREHFAG